MPQLHAIDLKLIVLIADMRLSSSHVCRKKLCCHFMKLECAQQDGMQVITRTHSKVLTCSGCVLKHCLRTALVLDITDLKSWLLIRRTKQFCVC